jgi:hypothetical protein
MNGESLRIGRFSLVGRSLEWRRCRRIAAKPRPVIGRWRSPR